MGRFDAQIATALKLIALNGQSVIWKSLVDGKPRVSSEPWKPTNIATPIERPATICFLPVDKVNQQLARYLGTSDVVTGNLQGLMGAVDFTPSVKDVVSRNGVELRITSLDILAPNGQIILYTIEFAA